MRLIPCPLNGLRPENEFARGGAIRRLPAEDASDAAWTDYLFMDENGGGEVWEWWLHTPSGFWFAMLRNTTTDECLQTRSVKEAAELWQPAPPAKK